MDFSFNKEGIYVIVLTLLGSTLIPLFLIIWPNIFFSYTMKIIFLGFRDIFIYDIARKSASNGTSGRIFFLKTSLHRQDIPLHFDQSDQEM